MAKENVAIEVTEESVIQERLKSLESRVDLIEIILKKEASKPQPEPQEKATKKIIQIIAYKGGVGERYFCETPQEQSIFSENNPGVKTESFTIEMATFTANEHLNNPENKKQFIKKE